MDVKELRTGNLIKKNGLIVTVDGRTIFDILGFNNHNVTKTSYSPIKLDKEWAERNAAAINNGVTYYFNSKSNYMPCIQFDDSGMAYWIVSMSTSVELPYVHTWQNLFFALTKTELKVE